MKSSGTTPSERYLAHLCKGTFLSLWSYPNIFRDQGQHKGCGDGKELCDLLVLHGNDIIIFSDKSCDFPDTGNLHLDWCRWFRRSVLNSAMQVYGAERWLRQHPDRLFLDRKCTQKFPLSPPAAQDLHFHRIVVALNAGDRCRREFHGNGGLKIVPSIVGKSHVDPQDARFEPFAVGQVDPKRGLIHVFDDKTLDIMLRELDTVSDFLGYLTRKEELISSGRLAKASEESDLLAVYLTHIDHTGRQHGFPLLPDNSRLLVDDGKWNSLAQNPQYIAKKHADKISYAWDHIIEEMSGHAVNGTLVYDPPPFAKSELILRIMASESRLGRRVLSDALRGLLKDTPNRKGQIGIKTVLSKDVKGTAYVFVAMSNDGRPDELFRLYRRNYLDEYCRVVAAQHKDVRRFVGLATEVGWGAERSYDLVY
ncbi:MAG: hypothetical protein IMZ44_05550, partial [Planctomycetes bacterium]|nr:hypothetical protein [Planctomycetota bacterium]